ncbi:NAD(P)H-dependent oxidoreductase [Hymenobacter negativus]|uniref:NAD(P)H-dependent oxidoreductase n=1 Tax=Hymenobacter negativus TaxID=2795026 RepID=A0ABS3QGR3_9BACT|nr:NAD(P)H-dependent oxidoreductase [Hymenobacter negativus]MBO2010173.1 NAD(P)H-dependent oxidoreductase [Hymenobacter negativus]
MNVLIVFAHPEPQSFNGALLHTAVAALEAAGHAVQVSNLYAHLFDPVSDRHNFTTTRDASFFKQQAEELYATEHNGFAANIEAELQKLAWCDVMIWQFPLWWFSVPAILKGWVDRVFAMGRAYGNGRLYEHGPFRGKRALLSLTTGGSAADYSSGGLQGELAGILRPIHRGMLQFTGFTVLPPHVVYGPARQSETERQTVLEAWTARLPGLAAEAPLEVGRY